MDKKIKISPELTSFINSVGNFIQYWGFKQIHGKTWALIYLYHRPLSSQELKDILNISKAQLSKTIKTLEQYHLIKPNGSGENGVYFYTAEMDFMKAIMHVLKTREAKFIDEALKNIKNLSSAKLNTEINQKNLVKLQSIVKMADSGLKSILNFRVFDFQSWKIFKK
jgi:DNA-binding transcriptional regulator GbsR (MarR family)